MQGEVYPRDNSHPVTVLKPVLQPIHSVPKNHILPLAMGFFLGWALLGTVPIHKVLRTYEDGFFIATSMRLAVGNCAVGKMGMH